MQYTTLSVFLSVLPFTLAQDYGYGSGSKGTSTVASVAAANTASSSGPVHSVTVGKDGLVFDPSTITAKVGETVEFHFFPAKHSVAQSSFAKPCEPLNATSFFSGSITTASGENSNVFTISVNDTKPIWFYCAFPGHCGQGMAGVINAPSDGSKTLEQYVAAAANVSTTVAPTTVQGGTIGAAQAQSSGTSGSSTSATSSGASSTSTGNAAVEARGGVSWSLFTLTGLVAMGFGSLIV